MRYGKYSSYCFSLTKFSVKIFMYSRLCVRNFKFSYFCSFCELYLSYFLVHCIYYAHFLLVSFFPNVWCLYDDVSWSSLLLNSHVPPHKDAASLNACDGKQSSFFQEGLAVLTVSPLFSPLRGLFPSPPHTDWVHAAVPHDTGEPLACSLLSRAREQNIFLFLSLLSLNVSQPFITSRSHYL